MSFLKYLIPATLLAGLPTLAYAGSHASGNLDPSDFVGISFWIISIAMVAATVFFLMESLAKKAASTSCHRHFAAQAKGLKCSSTFLSRLRGQHRVTSLG